MTQSVPRNANEKLRWRQQRSLARALFREHWDPIGLFPSPEAHDEYDAYADAAVAMVRAGSSNTDVANYLADIAENHMGLGPISDRTKEIEIARKTRTILEAGN